jgi:NitT/TauT family transport system ATP-binding protein
MAIFLKNLGKKYQQQIFSQLNLEFEENELVVFLGPSGCGKSTLLKILAGIEPATEGSVQGLESKKSAVVFQEARLLPWLSCQENITLAKKLNRSGPSDCEELLKKLDLDEAKNFFPHEMSGGMKMRTALARALLQNPEILFLDEPFSALDEPTRLFLQEDFRQLYEQNKWSVFFVTHSIEEACFLASKVIVFGRFPAKPFVFEVPLAKSRTQALRGELDYFKTVNELRRLVSQ